MTLWKFVLHDAQAPPPEPRQLGRSLQRLHAVLADFPGDLAPLSETRDWLERLLDELRPSPSLTREDIQWLRCELDALTPAVFASSLPAQALHGDGVLVFEGLSRLKRRHPGRGWSVGSMATMDLYPSLTYRDVEAALEFLHSAFGLEPDDVGRDAEGAVRYAALRHGDGRVLLQPDLPGELHGSHLGQGWVYVAVTDPDAHYERARAAGANVLNEPHAAGDAMRGYSARDLEGNLWSFGNDRPGG